MTYKALQYQRAEALIRQTDLFYGDVGGGAFRGKTYPFVLRDGANNLYRPILQEAVAYFRENEIAWWGGNAPTGHSLSSQIACLNHLFPLRNDRDAVLAIARRVSADVREVLPIASDRYHPAYIQFEAVSDADHLHEKASTRGSHCTSVDALIYAQTGDDRRILLPIEWKFAEAYGDEDKASGSRGAIRQARYTSLIVQSGQLMAADPAVYYFEPFYQLMRQTLWAQQMIAHRGTETVKAVDFVHVHVIPKENRELLAKAYPCTGLAMELSWRGCIRDQAKYRLLTPEELLVGVDAARHAPLLDYLRARYW